MEVKICNVCNLEKKILEFHRRKDSKDGLRNECKNCTRLRINNYRQKNTNKVNQWNRETYYRNITKHRETKKKYREINKETLKVKEKIYRDNNKEKINKYYYDNRKTLCKKALDRIQTRRKNDIMFRIKLSLRARVYSFLKKNEITKKNRTFELVGCNPNELKEFLEKKFVDGMCWENYGKWHIDHIIPLSSAKTEEEIYKLCHYSNLQPLWATDNLRKSNKIL
jgi:hypothetical protein